MINVVFWTAAAAAFVAAGWKARGLRRDDRPPGLGATCLLLVAMGSALVLISDGAQRVENAVYPNLGRLLSNLCTMVTAFAIVSHVGSLTRPPGKARGRIRRWRVALLVAMSAMTGLFVTSDLPPIVGDFGPWYRDHPALVGYILIFVVFLGWAFIDLAVLTVRYASPAAPPALRGGLRVVTVGCVLGIIYLAEKSVVVLAQGMGLDPPVSGHDQPCPSPVQPLGCVFSVGLPVLAALAITIGMTLPAWGPGVAAPVRWLRYRRTYRRLAPLWGALAEAMPQIVLPRGGLDRFSYRYGVHRRVIEIRDGLLLLRPYCDPVLRARTETVDYGVGLPGPESAALREAITIRTALAAYRSRRPATQRHGSTPGGTTGLTAGDQIHGPGNSGTGADLDSEAEWLTQVASAFAVADQTDDTTEGKPCGR